jgi:hypothetical protein
VLPFAWRGSQTPPDMSSTYSTLRHCRAMPLQMKIEEGTRSKAVRVGGLQYCQYSQEKISLITLLSDHVCLLQFQVCCTSNGCANNCINEKYGLSYIMLCTGQLVWSFIVEIVT